MNTSEERPSKEEVNRRKNEIRAYHQPLLDALGIPLVYVMGKMQKQDAEGRQVVFLYPTELEKGDDVYVEFTTRDYIPCTLERKLWKWKFDAGWKKYPVAEGSDHRLVPFSEFVEVVPPSNFKKNPAKEVQEFDLPLPGDEEDCFMKEMTLRDYASIHLKTPMSLKPWLNVLIVNSSKN
jgi:hypothetical protein